MVVYIKRLLDNAEIVEVRVVQGDIHRNKSGSTTNPESFFKFIDNGS